MSGCRRRLAARDQRGSGLVEMVWMSILLILPLLIAVGSLFPGGFVFYASDNDFDEIDGRSFDAAAANVDADVVTMQRGPAGVWRGDGGAERRRADGDARRRGDGEVLVGGHRLDGVRADAVLADHVGVQHLHVAG